MRVFGYVRVSTEEQAQHGISLAAQEAKLRSYASLYDLELVEVIADPGVSAKSLKRPGLGAVLAGLEAGRAEGILIAKLDRLTRSVADWALLIERYFGKRFSLMSVADQVDTRTAAGRLGLNILMSVSQWEREVISERTSAALQFKKSLGFKLGAPPIESSEHGRRAAARCAELAAAGMSLRQISASLASEGFTTQKGGRWHAQTVRQILLRVRQ